MTQRLKNKFCPAFRLPDSPFHSLLLMLALLVSHQNSPLSYESKRSALFVTFQTPLLARYKDIPHVVLNDSVYYPRCQLLEWMKEIGI
jgi:hypothetical protein